jgi:hypothetical protein
MLLSVLINSGCSSLKNDCLSLAPEGEWKAVPVPATSVIEKFGHLESGSRKIWFKTSSGGYGVCEACDESGQRAGLFQVEGGYFKIRTCGP